MGLSVVILTHDAEASIGATLDSLRGVSDDVHVVDSGSTDRTVEIAREAGARVVDHPFENYGAQRNWAIDNLEPKHEWQLHLDADERLSEGLAAELKRLKEDFPADVDGYFIPRLVHFLGRPIRHGGMYPIWHMRLFRDGKGRCESRLYDQHFFVPGKTGRLTQPMIDDHRMSLAEWTARHNRWADAVVDELTGAATYDEIRPATGGNPVERQRALRNVYLRLPVLLRPFLLFLYRYVLRLGFLDGRAGLIFFVLQSFWFFFLIDAKLVERRLAGRGGPGRGTGLRKAAKLARLLARPGYWRGLRFGVAATIEHRAALAGLDLATVVDVGANKGQFSLFARDAFAGARIFAFEPLAEPALRFAALFAGDARVTLHRAAIGPARGTAAIHVAARDDSSSLLPITERQTALCPEARLKETRAVDVAPLDAFLRPDDIAPPALLKLDVQGYELEALKGCETLLDRFAHVYVECSYVELYAGQALADAVVEHLRARGLDLAGIHNTRHDASGQPVQADFLFERAV